MSAPDAGPADSVLDVVARALGELRALTATAQLPQLYEVGVRGTYNPEVTLGLDTDTPEGLLVWCEATRVETGRCLEPGEMFPQICAATATGRLGGLAVQLRTSVPTEFAAELGAQWTVAQLAELLRGHLAPERGADR